MKTHIILPCLIFLFALFICSNGAQATPSANLTFTETSIGGGLWQYDFTLTNTSDPVLDSGVDLYDITLHFSSSTAVTVLNLPAGWDQNSGTNFIEALSLNPGEPPLGTDLAPGMQLAGFSFRFDSKVGALPFDVLLSNPSDFENPFTFPGTGTQINPAPTPTPEPSTLLLLGSGLGGIVAFRRKFYDTSSMKSRV